MGTFVGLGGQLHSAGYVIAGYEKSWISQDLGASLGCFRRRRSHISTAPAVAPAIMLRSTVG